MGKRRPINDAPVTIYLVGSRDCRSSAIKEELSFHHYQLIDLDKIDQPVLSIIDSLSRSGLAENGWEKVSTINRTVLDLVAKDFEKNYVLSGEFFFNHYDDVMFHQVKQMADIRGSLFLPVVLLPELTSHHPLTHELKESRNHLVLLNSEGDTAAKILAAIQKMKDEFAAQPDLICDEIVIDESENQPSRAIIKNGVTEYNKGFLGEWKPKPFSIYIRNPEGTIIAGVCGDYIHAYTRINWAWVHEHYRSRGVGRRTMLAVEEFAREKGCRYIQLDTTDFQAKPFYLKLGFWVVATLPNWINGHDCYIMRRDLEQS